MLDQAGRMRIIRRDIPFENFRGTGGLDTLGRDIVFDRYRDPFEFSFAMVCLCTHFQKGIVPVFERETDRISGHYITRVP